MTVPSIPLQREWIAISPQGEEQAFIIEVALPVEQATGEWTSRVTLGNIRHGSDAIHGMDSWQAVELAMHHAAVRVRHLKSLGWQFYWPDADREPAEPADLFRGVE
jgi:hypothetical protein